MALYDNVGNTNTLPAKQGDEYNRTHNRLVKDQGDAPSGRFFADPRLTRLFKYNWGGQDGHVTIPKGRIVAVAPDFEFKSFDDHKYYNVITLANGGQDVEERNDDPRTVDGTEDYVRVANNPCGVSNQNVYQDIDNSFKGNIPAFITRNTIQVPFFATEESANKMDWGSAYGELKPGDKVKSDDNGRFVKWNDPIEEVTWDDARANGDSASQIVGQVIALDKNMIPAGWLKWVSSESPNGESSNPTGFESQHLEEDGFPYDPEYMKGYGSEDYRPTGIEGLTDGSAIEKEFEMEKIGNITTSAENGDRFNFRLLNSPAVYGTLEIIFKTATHGEVDKTEDVIDFVNLEEGLVIVQVDEDVEEEIEVYANYTANGIKPGVPSNINWEDVQGSIDILLQL